MFYFVVEMDSGVLISLILGASTVIASFINCSFNRISRKAERLEAQNNKLFHDIESFLEIEQELTQRLADKTGGKQETIRKEVRAKVRYDNGWMLSYLTKPSEIQKHLDKVS